MWQFVINICQVILWNHVCTLYYFQFVMPLKIIRQRTMWLSVWHRCNIIYNTNITYIFSPEVARFSAFIYRRPMAFQYILNTFNIHGLFFPVHSDITFILYIFSDIFGRNEFLGEVIMLHLSDDDITYLKYS